MKMNGRINLSGLLALVLLWLPLVTIAQENVPFDKDYFPDRKDEVKEAVKAIKEADKLIDKDEDYEQALPMYLQAQNLNPNNADLNYKIAKCIQNHSLKEINEAIPYAEKAIQLNPSIDYLAYGLLGSAYHFDYQFDKAIEMYKKYLAKVPDYEMTKIAVAKQKIINCEAGKELIKNPIRVFVDNLGAAVNTEHPEYGPVITTDESVVLFTSRRPDSYGGEKDQDRMFYEDVYYSRKKGKKWGPAVNIGQPINSKGHESVVSIAPDGQSLILFKGDGNLYQTQLKGTEWTKPTPFPQHINMPQFVESSACLSYDGKTLFFVSDRTDLSQGMQDIFKCELTAAGTWGPVQNLGPNINTRWNEAGIFAHPDGKTIYFSSQGHNSMGQYDIFMAQQEKNGVYGKPVNLGYPINTPGADVFFVVNANGRRGYYASFNEKGYGEKDIYVVTILGPEKPLMLNTEDMLLAGADRPVSEAVFEPAVEVVTNQLTIFKGRVLDSAKGTPLEATFTITDNEKNQTVLTATSNSADGSFLLSLPSGKNYGISVKKDGYLFHSENFNLPEGGDYQEVKKDIELKTVEVGKITVLKNIFFDYDKATLRPESETELQNLIKLLSQISTLKIEISGHTDNVGNATYNQKLSERRAKAVLDYLIGKGISASRLTFIGYGQTQPIADNKTEEGRQENRRTEFKVIEK